jgi:Ca2+-binding RTX toxin-like protein
MDISIAAASANSTIVVKNFRKGEFLPAVGGNDIINGLGGADQLFGQAGDDTFRISGVREAFGELINGGSGLDTVRNVTTNDIVLTDFRTTGGHGRQTVFQVEQFFGNNKGILGRDSSAGADGVGNDTDDLDFTGIEFSGVTTINLRSGNDQYIGGKTALTVNGGTGNDTMSAGVGGGTLSGEAGDDTLTGGTAATTLSGGAGVDILNAGVGATTFNFAIADTNNAEDQVFGFRKGTDKIRLNTSIYGQGQLAVVAGSSPSGTGASSQIRYNNNGVSGDTTIYLPGTGLNAFRRIKLVGFFGALDSTDFIQV